MPVIKKISLKNSGGTTTTYDIGGSGDNISYDSSTSVNQKINSIMLDKSLDDLTDVDISGATNGEALIYNSTSQKWENGGIASSLTGLSDTTISSPQGDQSLFYNSSNAKWENGFATIAKLNDTNVANPQADQILKYNNSTGSWENGFTSLEKLSDVTLVGKQNGHLLAFNTSSNKWQNIAVDSSPTSGGTNPISSGGVFTGLSAKIDKPLSASNGQVLQYNGTSWEAATPSEGHTILPTPGAGVNEAAVVAAIGGQLDGTNNNIASLYGIQQWSNIYLEKRIIIQNVSGETPIIGTAGIGDWHEDESTWSASNEITWGWYHDAALAIEDRLSEWGATEDDVDISFKFDNGTSEPIVMGGYELDTDTGYICIKFGNEIEDVENAKVVIDIKVARTNVGD